MKFVELWLSSWWLFAVIIIVNIIIIIIIKIISIVDIIIIIIILLRLKLETVAMFVNKTHNKPMLLTIFSENWKSTEIFVILFKTVKRIRSGVMHILKNCTHANRTGPKSHFWF